MDDRTAGLGHPSQFGHRLDGAHLVVRVHHGNHGGAVPDQGPQGLRVHHAGIAHGKPAHLESAAPQGLYGVQDGLVLDRAGHQVAAPRRFQGLGGAPDGGVVALGSPACKDDLGRVGVEELSHAAAGFVDGRLGLLPEVMDARRVAVILAQGGGHRVHARAKPRVS